MTPEAFVHAQRIVSELSGIHDALVLIENRPVPRMVSPESDFITGVAREIRKTRADLSTAIDAVPADMLATIHSYILEGLKRRSLELAEELRQI